MNGLYSGGTLAGIDGGQTMLISSTQAYAQQYALKGGRCATFAGKRDCAAPSSHSRPRAGFSPVRHEIHGGLMVHRGDAADGACVVSCVESSVEPCAVPEERSNIEANHIVCRIGQANAGEKW